MSMKKQKYVIVTNNPLVEQKEGDTHSVEFFEASFRELLIHVRELVQDGHRLLTHPLSGSVKPKETPYKSVLLSSRCETPDPSSMALIQRAVEACDKFEDKASKYQKYRPEVLEDFQVIDWRLIRSGIESADEDQTV